MSKRFANQRVNVVGLGATGLSLVRYLRAHDAIVSVYDGAENPSGIQQLRDEFPDVTCARHEINRDELPPADFVALSPGVPRASFAIRHALSGGVEVLGDIELFARETVGTGSVFAITGSNGKTTTTAIAGELAKTVDANAVVAGNIGLPVLDALAAQPKAKTWVLELSSFQLESVSTISPRNAVVLNVSANHLDRYQSFFHYAQTKAVIYDRAQQQVVNRNDNWSSSMRRVDTESTSFGLDSPPSPNDTGVTESGSFLQLVHRGEIIVDLKRMRLRGAHNAMNAMAALALMQPLGLSAFDCGSVLTQFAGVPHRYQWMGTVAGVDVINDSKATTVVATAAALNGNRAPTWLIAGGDGKGQSFEDFAVAAGHCRAVHLIGRDAIQIANALTARGVPNRIFTSIEDATIAALDAAQPGDLLLLSPACASWDMFRNFEHRAGAFITAVTTWAAARGIVLESAASHA
jgi:UDP-N-acetylmuramoylalanine--D-glutamate ligase